MRKLYARNSVKSGSIGAGSTCVFTFNAYREESLDFNSPRMSMSFVVRKVVPGDSEVVEEASHVYSTFNRNHKKLSQNVISL